MAVKGTLLLYLSLRRLLVEQLVLVRKRMKIRSSINPTYCTNCGSKARINVRRNNKASTHVHSPASPRAWKLGVVESICERRSLASDHAHVYSHRGFDSRRAPLTRHARNSSRSGGEFSFLSRH